MVESEDIKIINISSDFCPNPELTIEDNLKDNVVNVLLEEFEKYKEEDSEKQKHGHVWVLYHAKRRN